VVGDSEDWSSELVGWRLFMGKMAVKMRIRMRGAGDGSRRDGVGSGWDWSHWTGLGESGGLDPGPWLR
jgi:hypothetical protein